ncbi:MAG: DUF1704 domain-containing protein [Candidatus Diapherotrites archaeon]|jgi:uncharacterized protein (TIGR02421 family)|uniref:DUF1704 domain-containing protein n=1 Tax=Candidatus Iainarchaeum sp. TaxID=3101447 RepID=A0A8T5GFY9_9ARCH|nr:DUF1704 domain-containing protein [Candidatus Diapherotrites archaeon]
MSFLDGNKFPDYMLLDQKVCQLASATETNILNHINPLNAEEEKKRFLQKHALGDEYNPRFAYAPRNPLYSYFSISPSFETHKKELNELLEDLGRDSLGLIFEKKILDLFERMELIKSIGTPNFSNNSGEYYGKVDRKTLKFAKELLSKKPKKEGNKVTFKKAKSMIDSFIKKKKLPYKVVQRESGGSKFSVNIRTKEIFINKDVQLTDSMVKRLIAHEIEGHAYRYENGLLQPYSIFARGLSKEGLETDEGLAITVEQKEKLNVDAQLREYAGRVLAVDIASRKNFYETFNALSDYFPKEDAFTITLRVKRGLHKQSEPGAFTKDALYLKGFLAVSKFLEEHSMIELYYGRYSVYDAPLVMDVDGLIKPKHLPECDF